MDDSNPYLSSLAESSQISSTVGQKSAKKLIRCLLFTAFVGIMSSFPLAGLIGLVFRFPVPVAGILSGPSAFLPAMVAAFIYGLLGGVFVQAFSGCVAGMIVYQVAHSNPAQMRLLALISGSLSALPGLLLLSMLDWIIGPW